MKQVVDGLKSYFEKALSNILLYRFERHQYVEILKSHANLSLCEIYGPEHLLRLFGMIGIYLSSTTFFNWIYQHGCRLHCNPSRSFYQRLVIHAKESRGFVCRRV